MKIILLIILCLLIYGVGKCSGEKEMLINIKRYIKESKNWNEVMEKLSVHFKEYDIGE